MVVPFGSATGGRKEEVFIGRKNRVIELQKQGNNGAWETVIRLHADVNTDLSEEKLDGGALQSRERLVFDVRYGPLVAAIRRNTQLYRILYDGGTYDVVHYDDFKEQHRNVRLKGVSYL